MSTQAWVAAVGLGGVVLGGLLTNLTAIGSDRRRRGAERADARLAVYAYVAYIVDDLGDRMRMRAQGESRDTELPEIDWPLFNRIHLIATESVRSALGAERRASADLRQAIKAMRSDPSDQTRAAAHEASQAQSTAQGLLMAAMRRDVNR